MEFYRVSLEEGRSWSIQVPHLTPDGNWRADIWDFTRCRRVDVETSMPVEIVKSGAERDFQFDCFGIPIVSSKFRSVVEAVCPASVQWIPTTLRTDTGSYWIANLLEMVDAIDFAKSTLQFTPEGNVKSAFQLYVDRTKAGDRHFFRLHRFKNAMIASESLLEAMDNAVVTGIGAFEV